METLIKYIIMFIIFILVIMGLSGCSTKEIEVSPKIALYAGEIQQTNIVKYTFKDIKMDGVGYACLSPAENSKYINNYQQLKRYIKEQKDVIEYYENVIKKYNK